MTRQTQWRRILIVVSALVVMLVATAPVFASGLGLDLDTRFYVPKPNHGAVEQIAGLTSSQLYGDAGLIRQMVKIPHAVWITGGQPLKVRQSVKNVVSIAADKNTVPVLVAYNIPFRDCAQYSAGGATSVDEYTAWIDAVAAGIGSREAVVILEPDGLGIIPWYTPINGGLEWCQPADADPAAAAADRFSMLNYAVDALKAKPNVSVYLDGTHSGWLNVTDASDRLLKAGVERADGFFLNVSNYQFSANLIQYGTWISKCIAKELDNCADQYWNGGPDGTRIAELLGPWTGVSLSAYGEWSDASDDPALNTSGINARYAGVEGATHFVVDTSRNGVGPWMPPSGAFPDPQDWCNPPDRALGLRPTADTGSPLLDAYLWIKIPGESDGQCYRGTGGPLDPARGIIDPPAGMWFPEMALELAQNANPPLP